MSTKTKVIGVTVGAFVLGLLVWHGGIGPENAHAANIPIIPGGGAATSGTLGDTLNDLMKKIALVNTFMHVLLLIVLQFLQYLLQADFFNDPTMMNGLFQIWRLARDVMNIIFAVTLIAVSFYVIITAKSDMIKEKIGQFVIAVILVNMSWFFPRVIIDVANVLTATVYSIPNMLPSSSNCTIPGTGVPGQPCKVVTAVLLFPTTAAEKFTFCANNAAGATPGSASCPCPGDLECHTLINYTTAIATMKPVHAMINGMAVSFARITDLSTIPAGIGASGGGLGTTQAIKTSLQIGLAIMMAFLVQIAVVLPLIGMAVGFLIRIIILWATTAFMPFSFLGYMVNGKLGTNVFGFEFDLWKEFINAAFLPATVGIPFVIGFIMLTTVSNVPAPNNMVFDISVPMINGVNSWWAMLWVFASVGIIWKGSFAALKKSELIGGFTEKIRAFGEYVGGGIAQLPLIAPLPIPGLKGANLGTVVHGPKFFADAIRSSAAGNSGKSFTDTVNERFGVRPAGAPPGGGAPGAGVPPGVDTNKLAHDFKVVGDANTRQLVDAINKLGTGNEAAGLQEIKNIFAARGNAGLTSMEALNALKAAAGQQVAGEALKDVEQKINDAIARNPV